MLLHAVLAVSALLPGGKAVQADSQRLVEEKALLDHLAIRADQLQPLMLDTPLVGDGKPLAWICHADDSAWREAAMVVQKAIREATGVELPIKTDKEVTPEQFHANHLILLGHLDNHRWVARLYHNFFVCLDQCYTGRTGYELRTVSDPFGTRHNYLLVGGSTAEGTRRAADAFAAMVRKQGAPGRLKLGRLMQLHLDPEGRRDEVPKPLTDKERDSLIARGRQVMFSPGQGRSGASALIRAGVAYHRYGDLAEAAVCRALLLALDEYYRTDSYITTAGMGRYDRDFRDAYTYEVAIVWDLVEECGLFSDQERLTITNLLLRLAMECRIYQGWVRPETAKRLAANQGIVHNHWTFPALSVYFVGTYLKRHFQVDYVDEWLKVPHGIFNGQKHCSKPMEDAAGYQWLPVIHTMIYGLAEDDLTFFEEGHARRAAEVAMMVMDNAGFGAAFGDDSALTSGAGVGPVLRVAAWYYRDPAFAWGADLNGRGGAYYVGHTYDSPVKPIAPPEYVGLRTSAIPPQSYEFAKEGPRGPGPNISNAQAFDKLTLRGGWNRNDEYLLLDGYGRGNHMHYDVNAIISYAAGGRPLLVDGEYIKNMPKYHNSLVVIRDGVAGHAPAVAGLGRAEQLASGAFARTWVQDYSGAKWTRTILWQRADYLLVCDEVQADKPGYYTLRCCWRPWGHATLDNGRLQVRHQPMLLTLVGLDGAPSTLEWMKDCDEMPISRLSQQVNLRLKSGQSYRFLNVIRAEPADHAVGLAARQVADDLVVVDRSGRRDVVAFQSGAKELPGVQTDAEALILADDHLLLVAATRLEAGEPLFKSTAPTSVDLNLKTGQGTLCCKTESQIRLRLKPACHIKAGDQSAVADAAGMVALTIPAGKHELKFDPCPLHTSLLAAAGQAAQRPAYKPAAPTQTKPAPTLEPAWRIPGIEPPPERMDVNSIQASVPPTSRSRRIENLIDRGSANSGSSAGWSPGKPCQITLELPQETDLRGVALCEWRGDRQKWGIGRREVQLSNDGFQKDVRTVDTKFASAGQREIGGGGLNVRMEATINQRARQVRINLAPTARDTIVYLSEIELLGMPVGKHAPINVLAAGDLDGDHLPELVAGTATGRVMTIATDGSVRWNYDTEGRSSVDAIACADLDGDGRAEVLFGGTNQRLGVLDGDGRLRWQTQPPRYRGLDSDVKTVFAADIRGDGRPAVVCGCLSWQYFAYDAKGEKLWQSVIYAHSASVGCAADLDADRKAEIIAGNVYYQLNVLGPDGKRRWVGGTAVPETTAVAVGNVNRDPRPEVLCGIDGGDVICFDAGGKELWRTNLGDRINRIVPADLDADGVQEILCASDSAQVVAIKGDGRILWRCFLPAGCADMAVQGQGADVLIAATAGTSGLVVLDSAGRVRWQTPTTGSAEKLTLLGPQIVVSTAKGAIESFHLPAK
jgi:hypothetical protein